MALKTGSVLRLGKPGLQIKAGAAAAFTPSSVSGLQAWYKADAGLLDASDAAITVDATAVKTWQDQSGNARHLTQATAGSRPLAKLNIQNSKPVVRFDGTDDSMQHQAASAFVAGTSMTVFIVAVRRANKANGGTLVLRATADATDFSSTTSALIGYEGAGNTLHQTYHFQALGVINSIPALGTAFLMTNRWDGTNHFLRRDGTDATSVGDTYGAFGTTTVLLGARWQAGANNPYNQLDYCEVLVYNTNVAAGDRTSIESYLKTKWGTP